MYFWVREEMGLNEKFLEVKWRVKDYAVQWIIDNCLPKRLYQFLREWGSSFYSEWARELFSHSATYF